MNELSFAILIPCHNEEKTIAKCVLSCLEQTRPAKQIIVVDDGSTDNSVAILEGFGNAIQLIRLAQNTGNKSHVQQIGLRYVDSDIFICTDSDSILDKHFIERIAPHFDSKKILAAAGYVISLKHNWLTALREIDYVIGQDVYKTAQSNISFLFVIPGCAAAFRTDYFSKIVTFDHDTLTEDLDFTYKFNGQRDSIAYEKTALVYTQDPSDLFSYIKQMRRWYAGGWQNLIKHRRILKERPAAAFELSLMYVEGLAFPAVMIGMPVVNIELYTNLLTAYIAVTVCLAAFAAFMRRRTDMLLVAPLYIVTSYINLYVFFEQFVKEVLLRKKNMVWFSPKRHI
ncbi:MAG: glycosyltransferase family 2 protein [Candidatus Pacebacteria bacterium]|jgi:biofilm PGA synthesis N-glycosyltransferase PgaC|nr:glycosyltransferase family 2 protein [Candidatus Paceibacterota bacterium]